MSERQGRIPENQPEHGGSTPMDPDWRCGALAAKLHGEAAFRALRLTRTTPNNPPPPSKRRRRCVMSSRRGSHIIPNLHARHRWKSFILDFLSAAICMKSCFTDALCARTLARTLARTCVCACVCVCSRCRCIGPKSSDCVFRVTPG